MQYLIYVWASVKALTSVKSPSRRFVQFSCLLLPAVAVGEINQEALSTVEWQLAG